MIISFQHKFIFIAVPKTAGHAIRRALRPHLGPNDWEQCGLFEKKSFPQPEVARIGHGHLTLQQAQSLIAPPLFRQFTTFAVIRDPYDRFVSASIFMHRNKPVPAGEETAQMKRDLENEQMHRHFLFRPQHEFLEDENGRLAVDHICRLESLQDDINKVFARLGLPAPELASVNASKRDRADHYYDDELRTRVAKRYVRDFELLGYPA